jgi:hypothetical protein
MKKLSLLRSFIRESSLGVSGDRHLINEIAWLPILLAGSLLLLPEYANAPDICDEIKKLDWPKLSFMYVVVAVLGTPGASAAIASAIRAGIAPLVEKMGAKFLLDAAFISWIVGSKMPSLFAIAMREGATSEEKKQWTIKIMSQIFLEILMMLLVNRISAGMSDVEVVQIFSRSLNDATGVFNSIRGALASYFASLPQSIKDILVTFGIGAPIMLLQAPIDSFSTGIAEAITGQGLIRAYEASQRIKSSPGLTRDQIESRINVKEAAQEIRSLDMMYLSRTTPEEDKFHSHILSFSKHTYQCYEEEVMRRLQSGTSIR